MTSGKFIPPDGDPNEFFQLQDQFRGRFQPFDEVEDALVERLDAGLFHFQAESNPLPKQYNKEGRTDPKAWAFYSDAKYYNAFSKLIRYEGFLQREFSRALRDLYATQEERRARLTEAAATQAEGAKAAAAEGQAAESASRDSEAASSEPETPPAAPKTEKTKRTQFPEQRDTPDGGWVRDALQNPTPNPFPGGSGDPPKR